MAVVDRARVAAALPGYTIGGELGSGGFGVVLAGHHQELDRRVAIKVLTNASAEATADFRAEARLLSRLDHPHIVRTYDYVTRGDLCLLVMELLPGGTLAQRRLPADAGCAVVLALADALALAHAHGVLHRDIKPVNVLFTEHGQPKLTDFGISKVIEGTASTASRVIGTPKYMAPEQITGGRLSPATDLYALSVVLYELLTGEPLIPPQVPMPALLRHHLEVVPPSPPGVPKPLAEMVLRSLAKRPGDRHPNARAFAADLARAATKVFGRGWLERTGLPVRIAEDIRALTTSRFAGLRGLGTTTGDTFPGAVGPGGTGASTGERAGRSRSGPLALGTAAMSAVLAATVLAGGVIGGGVGWAVWGREPATPTPPPPPPAWQPVDLPLGTITTVIGSGSDGFSGDGGPATLAELDGPMGIAIDTERDYVYLADSQNHRIRRVDRDGVITTVAGTGEAGETGDGGPATSATLNQPQAVAVADDGTLYIADTYNHRVRRVGTDGVITTIAGLGSDQFGFSGEVGEDGLTYSGDGVPAAQARLNYPNDLLVDGAGNLYISDGENNRVRRIGTDGIITTVAGTGVHGYGGDGGPATEAHLSYPSGLALGPDGSLYINDQDNRRIRRVSPDGIITTVAGTGVTGFSGDGGPATEAQLDTIGADLAVDDTGALYISDGGNSRIRRVGPDGTITTIAGTGESAYSGNGGPAVEAEMVLPRGIALDDQGILYIVDTVDGRVRAVRVADPPCAAPPCPTAATVPATAPGATPASIPRASMPAGGSVGGPATAASLPPFSPPPLSATPGAVQARPAGVPTAGS
ncbi:MAG: protein kinase [Frankia sp.]|nr:protein kinase [Frankia sp.]